MTLPLPVYHLKNHKSLEGLRTLLEALDKQQRTTLKNYLLSFSIRKTESNMMWKLAEIILSGKIQPLSLQKVSKALYGEVNVLSLEKLKQRLYSKILDSLLIDINTNRHNYEDETHPILVSLRKKMIIYDLLKFSQLKTSIGDKLVEEIISKGKKYEFFPLVLDAMYILKWNYALKKGVAFYEKMNREIKQTENCKHAQQRALDLYTQLSQFSTFDAKADQEKIIAFHKEAILELKKLYLDTNVKSVGYFLKTFEMSLCAAEKKFGDAKEVVLQMIDFKNKNKIVARKFRYGISYGYLAEFEIHLGNYSSAITYLQKSREYFSGTPLNTIISEKLEFEALFLDGQYDKARTLIDELCSQSPALIGEFRRDIFTYYKACCHFVAGEYRDALRLLNVKFELSKDRVGWEVNVRLLRIMCMVEQGHTEEARTLAGNLTKHIERYFRTKNVGARDIMLVKLFKMIGQDGFSFFSPGEKVYHALLLLIEKGKPHSWEPLTPELIPVHNWLIRKYGGLKLPGKYRESQRRPVHKKRRATPNPKSAALL